MPTKSRRTKPTTGPADRAPRYFVAPKGIVSTGWPAVEKKCASFGVTFRPWQPSVGKLILAKRSSGKYASTIGGTGLSIPRQVGKTFLVGAIIFALCLLRPNLTVIWTAHRLRTAEETFGKMQAFAKRKGIAPHIAKIVLGSGEEEITFRNGSRILFGARARGFGRGFDEVDVLIFDEAQILDDATLDDMIPATNQSRQETSALLLFMGTPPRPKDPGEMFTRMRTEALTGQDDDTGWVEFGADEDFEPTASPAPLTEADWRQIEKANPSYPEDTPREAILRMRKKLGPESFKREGLGIWDTETKLQLMPNWSNLAVSDVPDEKPVAFGLDMSHERVVSIGVCLPGDVKHLEVAAQDAVFDDTSGVVRWLVERAGRKIPVVVDAQSPAASMVPDLKREHVRVVVTNTTDLAKACGGFFDDVKDGKISHFDQEPLNLAVRGAKKRDLGAAGAGSFGWNRKDLGIDISPLVAVTLARYGAVTTRPRTGRAVFA